MPHNNAQTAKDEVDRLERLEEALEIIHLDLRNPEHRDILRSYIVEHKASNGKGAAGGSFNDFLKSHKKFKDRCKDKIVVAEIIGQHNPKRYKNILKHKDIQATEVEIDFTDEKYKALFYRSFSLVPDVIDEGFDKESYDKILKEYKKKHVKTITDEYTEEKKSVADLSFPAFLSQHDVFTKNFSRNIKPFEINPEKISKNIELFITNGEFNEELYKRIINEYVKECVRVKIKEKDGTLEVVEEQTKSFHTFLAEHKEFKEKIKLNKIEVGLGYDKKDEYSHINIDGGDFTGCRFSDLEIHAVNDVSMRDAVFDGVRLRSGEFSNIDLRGTNFYKCEFFSGDDEEHSLQNIKLGFADPNAVQDKGVFTITQGTTFAMAKKNIDDEIYDKELEEIKELLKEEKAKQGWLSWSAEQVGLRDAPMKAEDFLKKTPEEIKQLGLDKDLCKRISDIKEKYIKMQQEQYKEAKKKNTTYFENSILDPTYTVNQSPERANAIKIDIKATREDLEEYKDHIQSLKKADQAISFQDFMASRNDNSIKIQAVKNSNPGKMVVVVPDLSRQDLSKIDLSNLNLTGINFAYSIMEQCNCNNTNFKGSCLEGVNMAGSKFEKANLTDCNLIGIEAQNVSFKKAVMIRAQANAADFENADMSEAIGYKAVFADSNMEKAKLRKADMRRSNLEGVNLRYVDAQYADLRGANLSKAVADKINLEGADLRGAIANKFQALDANLENIIMDGIQMQYARLHGSILSGVSAKGADFTASDLAKIKADNGDFEGAILNRVNASLTDFENACMRDVQAWGADLTSAVLKEVDGEDSDIRNSVLTYANLEFANFKNACMQNIEAYKAKFKNACLERTNFQNGNLVAADFRGSNLSNADLRGAVCMATNFEGANVSHLKTDTSTILIDANLRGLIGDKETVAALKNQQQEQHKLQKQWIGKSRYGYCANSKDGSNDRFKCQRLGAAVLSTAIAGGTGLTLAGPLAGISTAAITALISDRVLNATKDQYFRDLGYLNNALGDRLAEIGAVALSMGVGATDRAIDGAVAGLVCSFAGVVQGAVLTALSSGLALRGLKLTIDGNRQNSRWKKFLGVAITAIGGGGIFGGISSGGTSLATVGYGAAMGGAAGGIWAGISTINELWQYDEENPEAGARPEQIYRESINRAKNIWRKIVPTWRKVIVGGCLAVIAAGIVVAVTIYALPALATVIAGATGLKALITIGTVIKATVGFSAITAAAAGFFGGYLYDNKIISALKHLVPTRFVKKEHHTQASFNTKTHMISKIKEVSEEPKKTHMEQHKKNVPTNKTPKTKDSSTSPKTKPHTDKKDKFQPPKDLKAALKNVKTDLQKMQKQSGQNITKSKMLKVKKPSTSPKTKPQTFVEKLNATRSRNRPHQSNKNNSQSSY